MEDGTKQLAQLSAQFADPARAAMVISLMDGSSRSAGELRLTANISPSSASNHLAKLVSAHVLTAVKQGRLKYYRIASATVAHAVEALTVVASPGAAIQMAARSSLNPFSFARTCYDHLAGKLGVEVVEALKHQKVIRPSGNIYEVTGSGSDWLNEMGIDCNKLQLERRLFATQCLDFTERRHHLAGALGAAFLTRMIELDWMAKSIVPRAVRLTVKGRVELGKRLRLEFTNDHNVRYRVGRL